MRSRVGGILSLILAGSAATAPRSANAQNDGDKFSLHGYLSQAYAKSDNLPISGIPKAGTWDYHFFALQMRYALTEDDQFVVQVQNRRVGGSLLTDEEELKLSWAYYRHAFGSTDIKVGRAPLPFAILNELRTVGTVLPFYRAPDTFYREGVETIDGIVVSNRTPFGAWTLASSVYAGGIHADIPIQTPQAGVLASSALPDNFGGQLWLETPVRGLRVGASLLHFKVGIFGDTLSSKAYVGSVEGVFDRYFFRTEIQRIDISGPLAVGGNQVEAISYAHGGVKLTDELSLNGQLEVARITGSGLHYDVTNDRAIGLSYAFTPSMVVKIEGHRVSGRNFDFFIAPTSPVQKGNYGIASFSVSF
jgi:hypothetical protein